MVFSSAIFLFTFLPLTFIGSLLIRQRWAQNAFLTLASLIFYAFGEPVYVFLMIASAGVNYGFGRGIAAVRGKRMKRLLLVLAVICDLAVLGVFKYAGFAVTNVNAFFGIALPVPAIRLPVGISFFTFQAMSYVIDVYRNRDMCQKDFMKVLLYISFFPQLIAGPIVRWNEIEEQIDHRCLNETEIADGICRFVKGLFKKLIFANGLGKVADHVFALNIGGWRLHGWVLCVMRFRYFMILVDIPIWQSVWHPCLDFIFRRILSIRTVRTAFMNSGVAGISPCPPGLRNMYIFRSGATGRESFAQNATSCLFFF